MTKETILPGEIGRLVPAIRRGALRAQTGLLVGRLSQISLAAAIVLIPVRWRFSLFTFSNPPVYKDYTDGLVFLIDLLLALLLVLWGLDLALRPRRILPGPWLLTLPLLGLTGMGYISILASNAPLLSFYHAVRLTLLAGLYFYLVNEIHSLALVIWAAAGQVWLQAAVGINQVLQQHSIGLQKFGELVLDPAWSGVSIVWAEGVRSLRAYGLSDHPNILGGCLAFALVMAGVWYATRRSHWDALLVGAFLSGGLVLFLTFSRSAWLGLAGGLAFAGLILLRRRDVDALRRGATLLLATGMLLAPFIWYNWPLLGSRLNQGGSFQDVATEQRSLSERVMLNAAAGQIFAEHAVLGTGLGTAPLELWRAQPEFPFNYQPPHNTLLNAAEETGIFGAAFYFLLLIVPWILLWLRRRALFFSPELIALSGALLALTLVGLFDYYPWQLAAGRFWQWLVWGLWASFYQMAVQQGGRND